MSEKKSNSIQKRLEDAQKSVDQQAKIIEYDPTRPRYHAICPVYWMNDPNGPILFNDEIHLFYQHHPFSHKWDTMHWGHMKTKDLVHWENLPIAFGPSTERGEKHCYSGCCIIGPNGKPTAIYTSIGNRPPEQWIALGSDDMHTWEKYDNNPVMDMEIHEESGLIINDWRDPYAWKSEDGKYYCAIGGHIVDSKYPNGRNPSVFLYTSVNLRDWEFLHPLSSRYLDLEIPSEEGVTIGQNWECPNFFRLNESENKWMLIVSPHGPVTYCIGDYINKKFIPKKWHNLDNSSTFYAPNSFVDKKGRNIVIGWMRTDNDAGWNGCFSIPRVIKLNEDDETVSALPIPEITQLRKNHVIVQDIEIGESNNIKLMKLEEFNRLKDYVSQKSIEIILKIPQNSNGLIPNFNCELFDNIGLTIDGTFGYDNEDSRFYIGRNSGIFKLKEKEESLEIRMFIDRSIVEIFLNSRWAISQSIKLSDNNAIILNFNAEDERIQIKTLEIWGINSIW